MYRRFLVASFRRCFAVFLLICLGCAAQSVSPDVSHKVERQVRKSAAALVLASRVGERFDAVVTGASPKGTFVRVSDSDVGLLVTRRVLEYADEHGATRFAVHPTLVPLLEQLNDPA